MKALIKQILRDRDRGLNMSHSQALLVQHYWLELFGTGGCSYPNVSENAMLNDLISYQEEKNNV